MRAEKQPKQKAVQILTAREDPRPCLLNTQQHLDVPIESEPSTENAPASASSDLPRLRVPDRQQLLSPMIIDELLEDDHPARAVWSYVEKLELSSLYDRIRARGSLPGRPAIDPRLLLAVWLYATLSGFTSAREIADLWIRHDAFRWLVSGVSINYHTLADFRSDNLEFLEDLLTQSVELLRRQGLIDLDRVAQDGMRVRANAGAGSFHGKETLQNMLEETKAEVQKLHQTQGEKHCGSG